MGNNYILFSEYALWGWKHYYETKFIFKKNHKKFFWQKGRFSWFKILIILTFLSSNLGNIFTTSILIAVLASLHQGDSLSIKFCLKTLQIFFQSCKNWFHFYPIFNFPDFGQSFGPIIQKVLGINLFWLQILLCWDKTITMT